MKIKLSEIKQGDRLNLVKYYDNAIQQVAKTSSYVSNINGKLCLFGSQYRELDEKEYKYWDEIEKI